MADHSAAKPAYSATACAARLGRLRETLDATGASGLLLIAGVDSRRHELSQRTLKWLLLGASGPGDEGACAADEAIDEVVLLVTRTGAKLYCTLASWRTLMPIVAHWRGLELHCLCETGAYEDADVVEAHKIRSFVGMLSSLAAEAGSGDLKKGGLLPVAMPVETAGEVERWPVVQAYALDDETVTLGSSADNKPAATGRGFFSMRHRVVPTFDFLSSSVLRQLDATSLRALHSHGLHRFSQQFAVVSGVLDRAGSGDSRRRLTERQLCEPLSTYFKHGLLRELDEGEAEAAANDRGPRVLFGPRTSAGADVGAGGAERPSLSAAGIESAMGVSARPAIISSNKASESAGSGEPTHLTLELADSRGPLACARTWFLRAGAPPKVWAQRTVGKGEVLQPLVDLDEDDDSRLDGGSAGTCTRALMRAYAGGVVALDAAISAYASALDDGSSGETFAAASARADAAARQAALATLHARGLDEDAAGLCVQCAAVDLCGLPPSSNVPAKHANRYLHSIRIALAEPPSVLKTLQAAGSELEMGPDKRPFPNGGYTVADTFALVRPPPPLGSSHTADKVSLQPLLLTAHAIPRVLAWLADGTEGRVAERVRMPLASPKPLTGDSAVQRLRCGEHYLLCGLLLPGGGATLVPPQGAHAVCAELMGQLYCFEEGIGFDSDRLGPVAIPFHLALESLSIFDGGSTFDASAEGEVDSAAAALVEEEAHMRGHQWLGFGGGAPVPLEEEEGEEHSLKSALLILMLRADACGPEGVLSYGPLGPYLLGASVATSSEGRTFAIALARGSPLRKALWRQCVPAWRESLGRVGATFVVLSEPPLWLQQQAWPRATGAPSPRLADSVPVPHGTPSPLPVAALRSLERENLGIPASHPAELSVSESAVCVHVLAGLPGSGTAELGARLRYLTEAQVHWLVLGGGASPIRHDLNTSSNSGPIANWDEESLKFDPARLQQQLKELLPSIRTAQQASTPVRVMLVAPPMSDPLAVMRAIEGIEPAVSGSAFKVGALLVCVDAREGADEAVVLPQVLLASTSIATHLLIVGCAATTAAFVGDAVSNAIAAARAATALDSVSRPGAKEAEAWSARGASKSLAVRLKSINPAAEMLFVDEHALRREGELSAALGTRDGGFSFLAGKATEQRERALPGWAQTKLPDAAALCGESCEVLLVSLGALAVLDEVTLLQKLGSLLCPLWSPPACLFESAIQLQPRGKAASKKEAPPTPSPADEGMQISHAELVCFVQAAAAEREELDSEDMEEPKTAKVTLLRAGMSGRALTVVSRTPSSARDGGFLLLAGPRVDAAAMRTMLGACVEPLHPLLHLNEPTAAELHALDAKARAELPLPAGSFYTGSSYVNEDGESSKHHPQLPALVEELRESNNRHAHAHNARALAAREAALAAIRVTVVQA